MRTLLIASGILAFGCENEVRVPVANRADTVHMRLVWEVAPGVHPTADSLGDISGLALDNAGNLYASDFLASTLWIFDNDGVFVQALGRKGEGPGEFQAPTGPAIGPDGHLYVRDVYRVSAFARDSQTGLLTRFEDSYSGPVYADWTSKRATRFDSTGHLLYPGNRWGDDGTATKFFLRHDHSGQVVDTLAVPRFLNEPQLTAYYRTGPGGGRMLSGLNRVPFAAGPAWDVTEAGTVVSGDGLLYQLQETDRAGVVIRTFGRDIPARTIPAPERRDSTRALRQRIDSVAVPLDQVIGMPEAVRNVEVPTTYPAYSAVYAVRDGWTWIRRPGGPSLSVFDVFDKSGNYTHTVVLPRNIMDEPTPILTPTDVVGVAIDPDTGENMILRFQVTTG